MSRDPFEASAMQSTLATASLPRRVHRVLEQLFSLVSEDLARELEHALAEFEQELFRLGERARNPALQDGYMNTLRTVRQHRADLIPHFLVGLETALTRIRSPAQGDDEATVAADSGVGDLRLVDDQETSEDTVLRMIAVRHEARSSLPLMLLGQRFGVLAGAPAFEAEKLPVGPQMLTRILCDAAGSLHVDVDARLVLYRVFDRLLTSSYPRLAEAMNLLLARENVLPGLTYVPLRLRPTVQNREAGDDAREDGSAQAEAPTTAADGPSGRTAESPRRRSPTAAPRTYTGWYGEDAGDVDIRPGSGASEASPAAASAEPGRSFTLLQELLAGRRELLGKLRASPTKQRPALPTGDVIAALGKLQSATTPTRAHAPRSVPDIRQTLLAHGRQQRGEAVELSREDSDTFELLGMLYTEIGRELREGTPSNALLDRLQVPLLRAALTDREFFAQQQHPARQLLNAVAEAGAKWLPAGEADPKLNEQLRSAVEHVVENYDGDAQVFDAANQQLQAHLQALARKAEISERRHIEAARGKEKLELAKRRAAEVVGQALQDQQVPRFVRTLLCQVWVDVLTLVLLRQGESSPAWRQHQQATEQIVAIGSGGAAAPDGLAERIEQGLNLVGYHASEATEIAQRLTSRIDDENNDPASRTELAMRLKARGRLGHEEANEEPPLPERNAREEQCFALLRSLPFGSWLEFVTNQQGDVVRRRLSWYSPLTGRALFVNQRGHRVDDQSLDRLARRMAKDQVRVVTADRGRLVDRAWQAALSTLRGFAGGAKVAVAQEAP